MKNNELAWIERSTSFGPAELRTTTDRETTDEWENEMMYSDQGSYPSER